MELSDLNLNIVIGEAHRRDYQQATSDGNLLQVRDILLKTCDLKDQAYIKALLPDDLVFGAAFKPAC